MKSKRPANTQNDSRENSKITANISLPKLDDFPKINSFYKKIEERCRAFCSNTLPMLYPDKNLFYCVRTAYESSDGLLTVKLRVTISERRAMRLLYTSEQTHLWRQKDQLLIKIKKQS